jgi:hypothetical protein
VKFDATNTITLCVAYHSKLHGVEWSNDHGSLIKAGIARAQAQGKPYGRPPISAARCNAIREA